jgi:hypothetical protein
MRKPFALIGVIAALCGCNHRPPDGASTAEPTGAQVAVPDPSKTHTVSCTADFGDIRQAIVVEVQVADSQVSVLQLGPPTNQVIGEAGHDISPKDFARLERAIAQAIDERAGRQVVVRARIVEVRYERIGSGLGARRGPKPEEP